MNRWLWIVVCAASWASASDRPNIIWIVGEDMGPELGCYGDARAITPRIDHLASEGVRFTKCFTHCPVCAPSRSGLITGRYPIAIGTHHMRSVLVNPPLTFTQRLQEAGYHVRWPGKTDFNFKEPAGFASSREPWHQRGPLPQPFFAYVNFTQSHESRVRNDGDQHAAQTKRLTAAQRHRPEAMELPPFWPDRPIVREEVARYYDLVTSVDYDVGDVLAWIERHGLADNTVVFFFGDHGRGMPRFKRWVHDTGTRVPLVVRWPGRIAPGTVRDDLAEFVDLPATALFLATGSVPADFDGQTLFTPAGSAPPNPRRFVHAHRDFMDEAFDRVRSVRDARFRYIRNYHPNIPHAQPIAYMELGGTMQAWRAAHAAGELDSVQSAFFASTKPSEELYDCDTDPFETRNLIDAPEFADRLATLRTEMDRWLAQTNDLAARMTADEMVDAGIILPRDPKYEERRRNAPQPAR